MVRKYHNSRCSGQAMAEFVIALISIMVVFVGIFTVAELQRADSKSMLDATSEAIKKSMSGGGTSSFSPIKDWEEGKDGYLQTKDDEAKRGNFSQLRLGVVSQTAKDGDWGAYTKGDGTEVRYNDMRQFNDGASEANIKSFGFVREKSSDRANLSDSASKVLGVSTEVDISNEVWMPLTGDLY